MPSRPSATPSAIAHTPAPTISTCCALRASSDGRLVHRISRGMNPISSRIRGAYSGATFFVYAPIARTMLSAVIAVAFGGRDEQSTGNQLFVSRDHVIRHGGNGALGVGVAAAEIAARAHEHVNDGLELFVSRFSAAID